MKPFHLQIQLSPKTGTLNFQWFAESAVHPHDSQDLPRRSDAPAAALVPDTFLVDLHPLLAEIAAGTISSAEELSAADEFLPLKDLLTDDDLGKLCDALFRFLYQQSQQVYTLEGVRGSPADEQRVFSDYDNRLVRVWFGTNRKPHYEDDISEGFSQFDSADKVTYGVCNVFIPKSHEPGSVGSPWWRRWFVLQADDRLEVRGIQGLDRELFWSEMGQKLHGWWDPGERNVFVLIHGFNVSFEEAAIRAAQIGYDLKLPGEIAFFSWPSRGAIDEYQTDEATITASVPHIAEFLDGLSAKSGAERIHIFVHSMGNRGFLSALKELVADRRPPLQLGQVFFCAPDEDVRTFKNNATKYPHECENRTLLVSPDDQAVFVSKEKHGQLDRVGYVPPVTIVDGMETIEVGGFGMLELGHGYFAAAKPVIEDIREAIATKKPAEAREIPEASEDQFKIDVRRKR